MGVPLKSRFKAKDIVSSAGEQSILWAECSANQMVLAKVKNLNTAGGIYPAAGFDMEVYDAANSQQIRGMLYTRNRTATPAYGYTVLSVPYAFKIYTNNRASVNASSGLFPSAATDPGTLGLCLDESQNFFIVSTSRLYWDNSNQRLGIRQSSPTSTVHSGGSVAVPVVTKSANYTLAELDTFVVVDTAATSPANGNITITLPTGSGCGGRIYVIRRNGTGVVTVQRGGSDTIYTTNSSTTATSFTVTSVCWIISYGDGTWHVLNNW